MRKRWFRQEPQGDGPQAPTRRLLPVMDRAAMAYEITQGRGGNALALLVYTDGAFELVNGPYRTMMDDAGMVSYWVGDHLVALLGVTGTPEPVPALRHLSCNREFPLAELTTERLLPA